MADDGWIPVGERLPEEYQLVDVWFKVRASPRSFGMADSWREPNCYRKDGKWFDRCDGKEHELVADYITHWRPLPAPPTEEK